MTNTNTNANSSHDILGFWEAPLALVQDTTITDKLAFSVYLIPEIAKLLQIDEDLARAIPIDSIAESVQHGKCHMVQIGQARIIPGENWLIDAEEILEDYRETALKCMLEEGTSSHITLTKHIATMVNLQKQVQN